MSHWMAIRKPLPARRALALKVLAFLLPIGVWCAVSYVPWIWHPQMTVTDRGGSMLYRVDNAPLIADYDAEQQKLAAAGKPLMSGYRSNPVFLPAPHEVGQALYKAFFEPPQGPRDLRLPERVGQSLLLLLKGFTLAAVIAVPLGLLCGTLDFFAKLIEPFVDFMRYMPAPAFGALTVAIFGLGDGPKLSIIFIGLFFNLLLVAANTVRLLDGALLEAAQTLGAKKHRLFTHVVLPGSLPLLYNDLRIALGIGWCFLTVAEIIGTYSGITEFINLRGKRFNFPDVYAGIIVIGLLGFLTDQVLGFIGQILFPWHSRKGRPWLLRVLSRGPSPRGFAVSMQPAAAPAGRADATRA